MALARCSECGETISNRAKACPQCGAPNPTQRSKAGAVLYAVMGIAAIIAVSIYLDSCQRDLSQLADDFRAIGD